MNDLNAEPSAYDKIRLATMETRHTLEEKQLAGKENKRTKKWHHRSWELSVSISEPKKWIKREIKRTGNENEVKAMEKQKWTQVNPKVAIH